MRSELVHHCAHLVFAIGYLVLFIVGILHRQRPEQLVEPQAIEHVLQNDPETQHPVTQNHEWQTEVSTAPRVEAPETDVANSPIVEHLPANDSQPTAE